jgi:hypothetical protein
MRSDEERMDALMVCVRDPGRQTLIAGKMTRWSLRRSSAVVGNPVPQISRMRQREGG